MNYTDREKTLIILSSITGLTYGARWAVLEALEEDKPEISSALIKRLGESVYNNVSRKLRDQNYWQKVSAELDVRGVECVTLCSADYPENLKNIPDPPIVLFCKGDKSLLNTTSLSIVGSRRPLRQMQVLCGKFAKRLAEHLTIVSGLADGADSAAIEGALEGGRAISVIAYGSDHVYPAANASLQNRVAKEGLLLSEYYPTVASKRYYFPFRNRIIAALSKGTLVVSAGKKSGALITADFCAEYGKELFVFPYNIGIPSGEGCNGLIKEGATIVTAPEDILFAYGISPKAAKKVNLTGAEEEVYNAIRSMGEAFLPELAERLQRLPHELIPILTVLEIKKLIVKLGGNRYAAI